MHKYRKVLFFRVLTHLGLMRGRSQFGIHFFIDG